MIDNIELRAFIKENLALARTIVIKNEDVAILDNLAMLNYYGIKTPRDKAKWRYYLNLNGDYHETDEVMTVQSLDDNEMIPFTKAVLGDHPATKKAYRLGSYYFSRLAAKYPHQIDLIQGIINPIPPEESIPAKPYQILRYTKDYVNWNESQLMPALQDHINNLVYQSFGTEYKYTDDLMLPFLVAHLRQSVFVFLLECRFENRFTRYAHPFYIWSYLQSHGISPIYKDLLNNKQTMWLFRNIDWVLRHLGKSSTFNELIKILLSERNIPLAKYDLLQSTEAMKDTLIPEPLFYSERLNLIETRGLGQTFNKIASVMLKEVPESIDNEVNYDNYLPTTVDDSTFGLVTAYPIKVLDSELVDTTNRKEETFFNVLINELIYLGGNGLYNINLDIEEPLTGIHQRVSVKDAVVLWHHLLNKFNGHDCDKIPAYYYHKVLRIKPVSLSTMMSVGTKPFLNENWCNDVLNTLIPQIRIISPSTFYENALAIYHLKWTHKKMYSRFPSIGYYSHRKNAISTAYDSGFIRLTDKKTYSDFLSQYDFDFSRYQKEDYFTLMWEIWRKATGWDNFSHITIAQIQSGMIGLMRFLSSYSVQYIHQTTMEDGWFEGGLDLLTENPMLLNQDSEYSPELELNVESGRIPVHHRFVKAWLEEEEIFYGNAPFDTGTFEADMLDQGNIYETPRLYRVDFSDDDTDNGAYSNRLLDLSYRLQPFNGTLPYDIEDLIPKGGSKADQHTLKEMIVDTFEGIKRAGPWEAISIQLPDNNLDNKNIAEAVDGFSYDKIIETKTIDDDTLRYYIGFSPEETGEHVIKLDILIRNTETQETSTLRFDYNTTTKQKTWVISFEIPKSVALNVPFEITPTITGLMLSRSGNILEEYWIPKEIQPYLSIDISSGKPLGTFLQKGWPDELPVMYVMTTIQEDDDPKSTLHQYFMKGFIPSDRYYDPLTDPEFEPVIRYNEADRYAITLENFTVTASNHGWSVTDLYLQKNDKGQYPADQVLTDYLGIVDYLSPTLSERRFTDEIEGDKTLRTFEWYYTIAGDEVSLDMVIELTNDDDGSKVLRHFTYTPTVIDHGAQCSLDILPEDNFKFGIGYPSITQLTVNGLGAQVVLDDGDVVTRLPNQTGEVTIDYDPISVVNNKIDRYTVKPYALLDKDMQWVVKLRCHTKTKNGDVLTIIPYATITLLSSDVVDYDTIDARDVRFKGWENNTIHAHAIIPSRYAISDLVNGWVLESAAVTKTGNVWPEFVGTKLPGLTSQYDITGFDPYIRVGIGKDGIQSVPEGYDRWFTLYMLGNREYLGNQYMNIKVPITLTLRNKYTSKVGTIQVTPENLFSGKMFDGSSTPDTLKAGRTNHVVPHWDSVPLTEFGGTVTSSEGIFLGIDKYNGGKGYADSTVAVWNKDDASADITMPAPPLSDGQGIRIYNKVTYQSDDTQLKGSSVESITYYPYIDYTKDMIERVPAPTYEDLDFTPLGNSDFYQGVRSAYVTLVNANKIYEYQWRVTAVDMAVVGTPQQDDVMITSIDGVDLTNYMYTHGIQANAVGDAPEGKGKYAATYVGFVPAKEGKQTIEVIVTLTNYLISGIDKQKYTYRFDIDVKPREGEINYASSYPDPWWLIGENTYVLTELTKLSGVPNTKPLAVAVASNETKKYATVATGINQALSGSRALVVNVKERFSDANPEAIVAHSAFYQGYVSADVRAVRYYFGKLPIRADRLYVPEDINLNTLEFKPDITFNPMAVNQSYTERYVYNVNTRGWYVNSLRIADDQTWMNHYFEYDGQTVRVDNLFNAAAQNVSKDKQTPSPDNKTFYLPMYGGRKAGTYPVKMTVLMSSKHHSATNSITLTYTTERQITDTGINLNLTYEKFYIDKKVELGGGLENVPSKDLHEGVISTQSTFIAVGQEKDKFTLYNADPKAVFTDASYPLGEGSGIMLGVTQLYNTMQSGKVMESATWIRGYRGEQVIPDSDVTEKIDLPDIEILDFTLLGNTTFYQGIRSTDITLFNEKALNDKGFIVDYVKLAAADTPEQSDVFLTVFDGVDISDIAYQAATSKLTLSDMPSDKKDYTSSIISFIPAKTGQQDVYVTLGVKDQQTGNIKTTYQYTLSLDVKPKQGNVVYDASFPDPWWWVGKENFVLVNLEEYPDGLINQTLEIAKVNTAYNDLISARVARNGNLSALMALAVTLDKKTGEPSPSVLVGLNAVYSGYQTTDPRRIRYFFDSLPVRADRQYADEDITSAILDFKPDIIFNPMLKNQSYVERYVYNFDGQGWEVDNVTMQEDQSWQNQFFTYDGQTTRNAQLFNNHGRNVKYDKLVDAPEGKRFFLQMYGGRIPGEYEVNIVVSVSNKHIINKPRKTLTYTATRTIKDSDIGFHFTFDELHPGKKVLVPWIDNAPTSDLHEGIKAFNTTFAAVGNQKNYFTIGSSPKSVTVNDDYPLGKGTGIMLAGTTSYTANVSTTRVETATWYRAYRGEWIVPDNKITEKIDYPEVSLLDFTPLSNPTFYQGVRSTYVTLFNQKRLNENGFVVDYIKLSAYGSSQQDDVMITSIDGITIGDTAYQTSVQTNVLSGTPSDKKDYASSVISFIPAKTGQQDIGVTVGIKDAKTGNNKTTYTYTISLDVQPRKGNVVYDTTFSDPWWLVNKETYVLVNVEDYPAELLNQTLELATVTHETEEYLTARVARNGYLSALMALAVTLNKKTETLSPPVLVGINAKYKDYDSDDPRSVHYFFDTLEVRADRQYDEDEITPAMIEFTPDVIFNPMLKNQSYVERFVYNINSRGWEVDNVSMQESSSWQNQYFINEGQTSRNAQMFNNHGRNAKTDKLVNAPEGKQFFLQMYGGRVLGNYPVKIDITLSNKHFSNKPKVVITYSTKRRINPSDINFDFKGITFGVGQKTLVPWIENAPTSDLHEGIKAFNTTFFAVGSMKDYFTIGSSPKSVTVDNRYKINGGRGVMVGGTTSYTANVSTTRVESATWYRAYRGEWLISNDSIDDGTRVFEIVPAVNRPMTGAVCSIRFFVRRSNKLKELGWVLNGIGVKGINDGTHDKDVIETEITGIDLSDLYATRRSNQDTWVVGGIQKNAFVVSFMLKHFKGQVINGEEDRSRVVEFMIYATLNGEAKEIPYTLTLDKIEAGSDVNLTIKSSTQKQWMTNTEEENNSLLSVTNRVPGNYPKHTLGLIKPYGTNINKTNVEIINSGDMYGDKDNARFTFSGTSNTDYQYAARVDYFLSTLNDPDPEINIRKFFGTFTIDHGQVVNGPNAAMFGVIPAYNPIVTGAVCGVRFYVNRKTDMASSGWELTGLGVKGMRDGTYDKTKIVGEAAGAQLVDLYTERASSRKDWTVGTGRKEAWIVSFMLKHFTGPTVAGREDRTREVDITLYATYDGKEYKIPYTLTLRNVGVGSDPTYSLSAESQNYWTVNTKDEKRTILNINNLRGSYSKRKIGVLRPFGGNASLTTVSTLNQGTMDGGTANTVFRFSGISNQNFQYGVVTDCTLLNLSDPKDPDYEINQHRYVGVYAIESFRVQDFDNWSLDEFVYTQTDYAPMFVDEYSTIVFKAKGFNKGLGISSVSVVSFSQDIVNNGAVTIDGVTHDLPVAPNYLLNVNNKGVNRLSTSPEDSHLFLSFMPKYAGNFTVKIKVTYSVNYSVYKREQTIDLPVRVFESRVRLGLIGDMVWKDTAEKQYRMVSHRVPNVSRDNMSQILISTTAYSQNTIEVAPKDGEIISVTPDENSFSSPVTITVFRLYKNLDRENTPSQRYGVLLRYRFYNNGYEWEGGSPGVGNAGRTFVASTFWLMKNGEKSQDQENGATPPARHIINGLNHSVSYAGGDVVNGRRKRQYVSGYVPECHIDVIATGESIVANQPVHLFYQEESTAFFRKESLRCRTMYLNGEEQLVMEFMYHGGNNPNDWLPLPNEVALTQQSFKMNDSATSNAEMVDLILANMVVENLDNKGKVTFFFDKPEKLSGFVFNAKLSIDSVVQITHDDGTTSDLQIRVENGFMSW